MKEHSNPSTPTPIHKRSKAPQDSIKVEGEITSVLPGTMFYVKLTPVQEDPVASKLAGVLARWKNPPILAHLGRLRSKSIRFTIGDKVRMVMPLHGLSPDNLKARIVYRIGKMRTSAANSGHKKPIRSYGPRRKKKSRSR